MQPNGTKSKKPSAQREQKNLESNAAQAATAESSAEHNTRPNQLSAVTQQQTINKSAAAQSIQTQPTVVHQVCCFCLRFDYDAKKTIFMICIFIL